MAAPIINAAALEHLAALARLDLTADEKETLLRDLTKILDYVGELKELDTANVEPMSGGTKERGVFREDGERENTNRGAGVDAFPESYEGFLKVPPVFNE